MDIFCYKHVLLLSMIIYLRISTYEHFQVWFSIGKNYIFTTSHKAHHNANGRHGRTNPTVHLLSSIHLHYTFCKQITNNYDILNMGFKDIQLQIHRFGYKTTLSRFNENTGFSPNIYKYIVLGIETALYANTKYGIFGNTIYQWKGHFLMQRNI